MGVHAVILGVHAVWRLSRKNSRSLVAESCADVERSQKLGAVTWAKIEPNCPEVTNLARMTQIRPTVHKTWPVDRLDLNAAYLAGLGLTSDTTWPESNSQKAQIWPEWPKTRTKHSVHSFEL